MLDIKKMTCFLVTVILFSCGSSKTFREKYIEKVQQKKDSRNTPTWVFRKPSNSQYYIGVGMVSKVKHPYDYNEKSKNNALADLTSEISVNVSSESVLNSLDFGSGISEDFSSLTKSSSQAQLEGFELVDTYESEIEFWSYYKLNKAKYKKQQEDKKNKILNTAKNSLKIAEDYKNKNDYKNALIKYIKAIEKIKPYWNEPLKTSFKNNEIFLGNYLIKSITDILNDIQIVPINKNIIVTRGMNINPKKITVKVLNSKNKKLNLPLIYHTTNNKWKHKKGTSKNGEIELKLKTINSKNSNTNIIITLNFENIIKESTKDLNVIKLIKKISLPKGNINVSLNNIKAKIIIDDSTIKTTLKSSLKKIKIEPVEKSNSNFIIKAKTSFKHLDKGDGFFYKCKIKIIFDIKSDILLGNFEITAEGKSIKNKNLAKQNAYKEIIDTLKFTFNNKLKSIIFK